MFLMIVTISGNPFPIQH